MVWRRNGIGAVCWIIAGLFVGGGQERRDGCLPFIKMHEQLVHVGCNVAASCVGCEGGLLEAEEGCGECGNALLLELAAGLEAFPGGGDFDADPAGVEVRAELLEVRDDSWADITKNG